MKPIKTTGFAAVNILTKPPHIMTWSVNGNAAGVRKAVADNWPERAGSPDGWKNAKKDGIRVRKVEIRTVP